MLGTTGSQAVLGLLFGRPDESFYVREIVRATRVGQGAVQRELQRLAEAEIIDRVVCGRQVFYQANRRCPIFAELQGLVVKTAGVADVLRAALAPLVDRIVVAFVFGSSRAVNQERPAMWTFWLWAMRRSARSSLH